jgi:hypothetical protein
MKGILVATVLIIGAGVYEIGMAFKQGKYMNSQEGVIWVA